MIRDVESGEEHPLYADDAGGGAFMDTSHLGLAIQLIFWTKEGRIFLIAGYGEKLLEVKLRIK